MGSDPGLNRNPGNSRGGWVAGEGRSYPSWPLEVRPPPFLFLQGRQFLGQLFPSAVMWWVRRVPTTSPPPPAWEMTSNSHCCPAPPPNPVHLATGGGQRRPVRRPPGHPNAHVPARPGQARALGAPLAAGMIELSHAAPWASAFQCPTCATWLASLIPPLEGDRLSCPSELGISDASGRCRICSMHHFVR